MCGELTENKNQRALPAQAFKCKVNHCITSLYNRKSPFIIKQFTSKET